MELRKLSEIEVSLNSNAIKRIEKRNKHIESYLIPKTELDINFGLPFNFEETMKELNAALKEWKGELKSNEAQIKILTDQNENGVQMKEKKEVNYV